METITRTRITSETLVNARIEKVWDLWTEPKHILHWNFASIDWHTTYAENDLRVGGKFLYRMESKDGRDSFDFAGTYSMLEAFRFIEYYIADGRRVRVTFDQKGLRTRITELYEAELTHSVERQRETRQAILDNFKIYTESPYPSQMHSYEIEINSGPDIVYNIITDKKHYAEWMSLFNSDPHFEGTWKKRSKMRFMSTKDGKKIGMVSMVKENIPGKLISLEHIGIFKNGIEITCGPDIDDWQGALENYSFSSGSGRTVLAVDIDTGPTWIDALETWPKALLKLKEICEKDCI